MQGDSVYRSSWSNSNNWARVSESSAVMQAGAMANSAHEFWLTDGSGESEGGDHIGRMGRDVQERMVSV